MQAAAPALLVAQPKTMPSPRASQAKGPAVRPPAAAKPSAARYSAPTPFDVEAFNSDDPQTFPRDRTQWRQYWGAVSNEARHEMTYNCIRTLLSDDPTMMSLNDRQHAKVCRLVSQQSGSYTVTAMLADDPATLPNYIHDIMTGNGMHLADRPPTLEEWPHSLDEDEDEDDAPPAPQARPKPKGPPDGRGGVAPYQREVRRRYDVGDSPKAPAMGWAPGPAVRPPSRTPETTAAAEWRPSVQSLPAETARANPSRDVRGANVDRWRITTDAEGNEVHNFIPAGQAEGGRLVRLPHPVSSDMALRRVRAPPLTRAAPQNRPRSGRTGDRGTAGVAVPLASHSRRLLRMIDPVTPTPTSRTSWAPRTTTS